jgi:hypothetical protein
MGILVPETCWGNKTAYFIASSWFFAFTMSTMHGHINIKFAEKLFIMWPSFHGVTALIGPESPRHFFKITLRHNTLGTSLDRWTALCRPLPDYKQQSQQRDIHGPGGIEPAIPACERAQTHNVDRMTTGISTVIYYYGILRYWGNHQINEPWLGVQVSVFELSTSRINLRSDLLEMDQYSV